MFHLKDSNQYSLGNECEQCCCKPRNLKYSTETNLYLAPEIWSIVFKTLKENTSTDYFLKKKMENRLSMPDLQEIFTTF